MRKNEQLRSRVSTTPVPTVARNLLVCAGAYYLSRWLVVPLVFAFGKMTQGLIYTGEFIGNVGATVVWLVESDSPVSWAVFLAIFYGLFTFLGYRWAHPPTFLQRVGQTLAALFPAATCVMGALVARQRLPRNVDVIPD